MVFLVENNQYGMGTEVGKASAVSNIYQKGCAYDIAHRQIDGQDVFETYQIIDKALELARAEGPVLLEAMTYRYVGTRWAIPNGIAARPRSTNGGAGPDPALAGKLQRRISPPARLEQIRKAMKVNWLDHLKYARESPEPDRARPCGGTSSVNPSRGKT